MLLRYVEGWKPRGRPGCFRAQVLFCLRRKHQDRAPSKSGVESPRRDLLQPWGPQRGDSSGRYANTNCSKCFIASKYLQFLHPYLVAGSTGVLRMGPNLPQRVPTACAKGRSGACSRLKGALVRTHFHGSPRVFPFPGMEAAPLGDGSMSSLLERCLKGTEGTVKGLRLSSRCRWVQ